MLTLIEIDGQLYHAQDIYAEDGENVIDTIPILDEIEQNLTLLQQ